MRAFRWTQTGELLAVESNAWQVSFGVVWSRIVAVPPSFTVFGMEDAFVRGQEEPLVNPSPGDASEGRPVMRL